MNMSPTYRAGYATEIKVSFNCTQLQREKVAFRAALSLPQYRPKRGGRCEMTFERLMT